MAIVSSIQGAQKDNLKSFNNYMMQVLEVGGLLLLFYSVLYLRRACRYDNAFRLQLLGAV
jgi:hypothetical protein